MSLEGVEAYVLVQAEHGFATAVLEQVRSLEGVIRRSDGDRTV
jgi:hypothetical protein